MKTKLTLLLCSALILASCASGKKASCDAYGSIQPTQKLVSK